MSQRNWNHTGKWLETHARTRKWWNMQLLGNAQSRVPSVHAKIQSPSTKVAKTENWPVPDSFFHFQQLQTKLKTKTKTHATHCSFEILSFKHCFSMLYNLRMLQKIFFLYVGSILSTISKLQNDYSVWKTVSYIHNPLFKYHEEGNSQKGFYDIIPVKVGWERWGGGGEHS